MGCCASRLDRQELVSRCRARKRYMKQLVQARQCLSVAHSFYVRSLRSTGSSLLQFATNESSLLHYPTHSILSPQPSSSLPPPLPPTPPPPPSISPSTDTTWTTTTASSAATNTLPPPPPPPPPASDSTWDFWDPFAGGREEEEWADDEDDVSGTGVTSTTMTSEVKAAPAVRVAASVAPPPSVVSGFSNSKESEMAVVVSRQGKVFVEIIKELDEYFLRAADAASCVSGVLEVPTFTNHHHLPPSSGSKVMNWSGMTWNGFGIGKMGDQMVMGGKGNYGMTGMMGMVNNGGVNGNVINAGGIGRSHCSTVERLYAWEKKLFLEV